MFTNLTYEELSLILNRARIAFKEDVRHYGDEHDEMMMNLCEDIDYSITNDTTALFFTIKDYEL